MRTGLESLSDAEVTALEKRFAKSIMMWIIGVAGEVVPVDDIPAASCTFRTVVGCLGIVHQEMDARGFPLDEHAVSLLAEIAEIEKEVGNGIDKDH